VPGRVLGLWRLYRFAEGTVIEGRSAKEQRATPTVISTTCCFVAFSLAAADLIPSDTNHTFDVFGRTR
jgi:hypothetical protein